MPTTAVTAFEVLFWKLGSFEYWAVIESWAIGSAIERVAVPPLTLAVPREAPLAKNVTFPLNVPAPGLTTATVAVSVTCSKGAGLVFDKGASVVVVGARTTAAESTADVLPP